MKKLLILVLVLGMASMASANLSWSQSAITLGINESATVQIVSSTTVPYAALWMGANASTVAQITAVSVLPAAVDGSAAVWTGYPGWWDITAKDNDPDNDPALASGNHFDVTIKGLAVGTYVINSDYYGQANLGTGVNDTLTITVPEPMTIALLGLGGLFLRRRR